ncbi:crossover junction endonuclease eme1 [Aspergillus udagawae]|uniref:Crossover junction endonuclease eme1 n=1 Tax=Aspergillus udagawae TaxID=91492 RepID=A0ABQ1A1K2_9EURO|nr:crossover junction endonuclease eme1 [Aspergillus udagawae]GFF71310.1 crossover junction endonuclease eme1 [Aspergillus udagawae]GFG22107.1 crossover junction endonuclease eme1 [Aspergillus udagawae]
MPEVINLLSSTPPPPASQPRQPLVATLPSDPRLSSAPRPLLSDDIESLFAYDDIDKPAKRRRLSEEVESPREEDAHFSRTNLFLFSDDDVALPSDGPSTLKIPAWNEESDPIVFTSPAPVPVARPLTTNKTNLGEANTITIDDDDDDDDDDDAHVDISNDPHPGKDHIEDFSDQLGMPDIEELVRQARTAKPSGQGNTLFSSRTASLLAGLEERSKATSSTGSRTKSRAAGPSKKAQEHDVLDLDDDLSEVVAESRKPARKTNKLTAAEKEARAKEREAAKAQREHEKQLEKERQKKLREEKAREKQLAADLAEVNKLKVDKKESTPEMILDLASSFRETSVGNQSIELMKRLGVEHTFFTSSIPNVVKWRRKVTARYNETAGHWEPCPHHIREEDHILCLVTAQDFVNMVIAPADPVTGTTELELHLDRIKKVYPRHKPIYLIEGLTAWMRKNQNSRNRAFQAQVRRQLDQNPDDPSSSTRRRKPPAKTAESTPPVDDDTIEDALLELQVTHACLIHHTSAAAESAEWIKNFTEHISTIPYKRERMDGNDSAFCMDTGQVKPGEDKADTFVKMLQEVNRVTASMAYGIAARYPSVVDLVRGMRRHGPTMLEDVKKSANKNGALTDSRIGPAASKRLYKVFMGLDPSSTDV